MSDRHAVVRTRHELKRRRLTVIARDQLTPRMVRVTFAGPDLTDFVSLGHDDHVKIFFPGEDPAVEPTLGLRGPVYPEGVTPPPMRDFTPRSFDPVTGLLTVDFALHETGPATTWAETASPGQSLAIGGPRGSMVVPDDFDWYLLAGDETALPAIARRLEQLRPDAVVLVVVTVVDADDEISLPTTANTSVRWVHRPSRQAADPSPLLGALAQTALPEGEGYAWIAAESGVAKAARAHLVERGQNPSWLKAAGYWRAGDVAVHDHIG